MDSLQNDILLLLQSALNGEKVLLSEAFDWEKATKLAVQHNLAVLLYYGARNSEIEIEKNVKDQLEKYTLTMVMYDAGQEYESKAIYSKFNENDIEYLPLKGAILKNLYPKREMRYMGDIDILIKPEQYSEIVPLMEQLGYSFQYESDHEFVWKKNKITIELHKRMMGSANTDFLKYLGDGWKFANCSDEGHYVMSDDDFYVFLFIHLAKHYRASGIGISHMLDLWVFRNTVKLNEEYIVKQMKRLGISEFYFNILETLDVWFNNKPSTDKTDFITGVIFNSGAYGTKESEYIAKIVRLAAQKGNGTGLAKAKHLKTIELIFPPYKSMCEKYPVLKKVPFLLPLFWIIRFFNAVLFKRKYVKNNIKSWNTGSVQKIEEYKIGLDYVGLDYKFGE